MAITNKEEGVWILDEVYNKQMEGGIWAYNAVDPFRLFAWGYNSDQNLGLNDRTDRSSPTQIGTDTSWGTKEVGTPHTNWIASSSASCTVALKQDGTMWWWSENKNGTSGSNNPYYTWPSSPIQVGTDTTWRNIANSGNTVTLATKTDGTLWSWGQNANGALGLNQGGPSPSNNRSSPCQVGTDTDWSTPIVSSCYSAFAVKTDGTLWAWGSGGPILGQNEGPSTSKKSSPVQVGTDTTWTSGGIVTGNGVARFVKTDGTLWTWGTNNQGCLGLNEADGQGNRSSPMQVGTDTNWKNSIWSYGVSGENQMALAVKTDGTLWSWGYNRGGCLGQNDQGSPGTARSSPTQIGSGTDWDNCMCGSQGINFAVKTDGTAWVWGVGTGGQLGLNQSGDPYWSFPNSPKRSSPTQIPGTDWAVIKQNYFHQAYALRSGT